MRIPSWVWGLAAFAISLAHFSTFEFREVSVQTDIRYFLYFAWRVSEGETPYADLFDPKTPLSMFAGAVLYRTGELLDVDPIHAVRAGYLGLAALGGWLAFLVGRALGRGRPAPGFLGLFAYCAFGLLGDLPSLGNVPKLLMALAASATGLLCFRGRFVAAGASGVFAFLDWQIGALAWLGAFAAALLSGPRRVEAAGRVVLGGALGMAPVVAFFAARGALFTAFDQTILAAFFRGTASAVERSGWEQALHVARIVGRSAGEQAWLCAAGAAGAAVVLVWLWTRRREPVAPLLQSLSVYHFGLLAFTLVDFQRRGDAFAVLHSVAFFLGVGGVALYLFLDDALRARAPASARRPALGLALAIAFVAARPGPLRPAEPLVDRDVTIADQREVVRELETLLGDRELALVEQSEILLLLRRPNPLPFIYWNAASWGHYCDASREPAPACLRRLLDASGTDARIVQPTTKTVPMRFRRFGIPTPGDGWRPVELASANRRYAILVHLRQAPERADVPQ
ncbi:MAG: hypothetical protein QNK04_22540 [Myxococcota bacterium]|nr:hypothetical protein [Myxococcota bacterium]